MKIQLRPIATLVAALTGATLLLAGCGEAPTASYSNSSGTLALSRDDAFLYAVDTDNDLLGVVDTASQSLVAEVKVGRAPERVVVGPDDTVYVSNRGSRSVSVIKRGAGSWSEVFQISVGVEPVGMAVSPDNKTLYVVNGTSLESPDYGTLTAVDVKTLQPRWELKVGQEPRGVTLLNGNRALVTLLRKGDVVTVDLERQAIISNRTNLYDRANEMARSPSFGGGFSGLSTFHPRAMADAVVTPDGQRAFVPTVWARESALSTTPGEPPQGGGGGGGDSYGGGPCGQGGVATPGVATFESTAEGTVAMTDDVAKCHGGEGPEDFPAATLVSPREQMTIQGPVAAAVDSTGAWLWVVNRESNNVAVLPANNRRMNSHVNMNMSSPMPPMDGSFRLSTVRSLVPVGSGPTGIALTRDGKKAYVYNSFDHTISTIVRSEGGVLVTLSRAIRVADDILPADVVAGRKLFFAAADSRMTASSTGVACATCHLEAREDGHVWLFSDGPRQTPSLAGRKTTATAPFHWNGEFNTLADFLEETVKARMGGTGATTGMGAQLAAFIDSIPEPENVLKTVQPSEAQLRGAQAFQKANCQSCHAGSNLTDNTFHDVGTMVKVGAFPDRELDRGGLNVPSLLGLARTAPYLHDGSAATLRDRLLTDRFADKHGKTSLLSDGEIDDLVEYLKTL